MLQQKSFVRELHDQVEDLQHRLADSGMKLVARVRRGEGGVVTTVVTARVAAFHHHPLPHKHLSLHTHAHTHAHARTHTHFSRTPSHKPVTYSCPALTEAEKNTLQGQLRQARRAVNDSLNTDHVTLEHSMEEEIRTLTQVHERVISAMDRDL